MDDFDYTPRPFGAEFNIDPMIQNIGPVPVPPKANRPSYSDIPVRQSKATVIESPSPQMTAAIKTLLDISHGRGGTHELDLDRSPGDKQRDDIAESLAHNPQARQFVLDHVIPRTVGQLSDELKAELEVMLCDPESWKNNGIIYFTPTSSEIPQHAFHSDALVTPGELTIFCSFQKSTTVKQGWFTQRTESPAEGQTGFQDELQADPGQVVLMEAESLHSTPTISQEEIASFGGDRELFIMRVGFSQVIERAQEAVLARESPTGPGAMSI